MEISLYNTLSRSKETFKPLKKGQVGIYNCGPTVYDTPHIGNFRTFVMYDILRRVFEYDGYKVTQVMNSTDVDDKTIKRSVAEGVSLKELTEKYEKLFLDGLKALNIEVPQHFLRATENIQPMIDLIQILIDKGVAYKANDGVYMSIAKVKDYGRLANISPANNPAKNSKERIANDEYDKENPSDFAVWKFRSKDDGEAYWEAPFGSGRPGWHIECSAMAMKILGPTIDVHAGGMDLIFPHHTNEIAQSESATGKTFANYWVHGGFMNVTEEKMAKSKGNFIKLKDLEDNKVSPIAFRYWLLTAHYRSPINFTYEAVKAAQNALIKLMATVSGYSDGGKVVKQYQQEFNERINDDMDMPGAIAIIWKLIKDDSIKDLDKKATVLDFDKVLGLKLDSVPKIKDEPIPNEIIALADAREEARKSKDWKKGDALRLEIEARGFEIKDGDEGYKIVYK